MNIRPEQPSDYRDVENLVQEAVRRMPGLGLGCDIMTGFPGETELDFRQSAAFVARHRFSNVHAFPFSRRPGTVAASLPRQCDHETRSERAHEIADIARRNRADFAAAFRSREVEIVVEDEEDVAGWTSEYLWCTVPTAKRGDFPRKSIRRVRVVSAESGKLVAAPVSAL